MPWDLRVELVNLRVRITGPTPPLPLIAIDADPDPSPPATAMLYGISAPAPIWKRNRLRRGEILQGPALITDAVSTTYLAPGWQCQRDDYGNLLLERA